MSGTTAGMASVAGKLAEAVSWGADHPPPFFIPYIGKTCTRPAPDVSPGARESAWLLIIPTTTSREA